VDVLDDQEEAVFVDRDQRIRGRFVGGYVGEAGHARLPSQILALLRASP